MKKKTVIIFTSVVFAIILFSILCYRIYLLKGDNSGIYSVNTNDYLINVITYLPEISVVTTIIAIFTRKGWGFVFTLLACLLTILSLAGELFIKLVKTVDVIGSSVVPAPCVPWLNLPVLVICVLLFIMKFRIYTLPNEIKIKLKIVNLC